jgi:sulfate adenylyltransferase
LKGFTGVDDPYENPIDPDLVLTTTDCTPEENARKVVDFLTAGGFLREENNSLSSGSS